MNVLVGESGTGKTHLVTAIGVQAILHHHYRVRCFSIIELVNASALEKVAGKQGQIAHRRAHADLVALDELGYLPFSQTGGALLFHLISKLYERTSLAITEPELRRMACGLWRCQDGHCATGSAHTPLPYRRDRQ